MFLAGMLKTLFLLDKISRWGLPSQLALKQQNYQFFTKLLLTALWWQKCSHSLYLFPFHFRKAFKRLKLLSEQNLNTLDGQVRYLTILRHFEHGLEKAIIFFDYFQISPSPNLWDIYFSIWPKFVTFQLKMASDKFHSLENFRIWQKNYICMKWWSYILQYLRSRTTCSIFPEPNITLVKL